MSIDWTNKLGPKPIINQTPNDKGLRAVACSQLVVTREVYDALVKEMQGMQQMENKAAADRNWSMADALKQKRLAFDAALGVAMRAIDKSFNTENAKRMHPHENQ